MPSTLFARDSEFQRIELVREDDGTLSLTLDDVWQFSSRDEARFHEVLVDVALVAAPRIARVAILGGGDGLAARNALRYAEVESLVLCELDPDVIEMTRTVEDMRRLSAQSLDDSRVEVIIDDATRWLRAAPRDFDVVICDFPAATDAAKEELHGSAVFAGARRLLAPGGVLSAQVSLDPPGFWSVVEAAERSFAAVTPRLLELEDDLWADFLVASAEPLRVRRALAAAVTHMTLTRVESLRILNRAGDHFETEEYGARPEF